MAQIYNWATPKGAKIEFTVNTQNITSKTLNADGHEIVVECDEYRYDYALKINGTEINSSLLSVYNYRGVNAIEYGKQGKNTLLIAIPNDVYNLIFGEEMEKRKAKTERMVKADNEYQKHCDMMRKAMQE